MTFLGNMLTTPAYSVVISPDFSFSKFTNFIIFTIGFNMKLHTISDCFFSHWIQEQTLE